MIGGSFGLFELALRQGQSLEQARTIVCNMFVVIETLYLFNCRSLSRPFWAVGAFGNPWIWAGSAAMLAAQLAFTYVPAFNRVFHTAPLDMQQWLGVLAVGGACALTVEFHKQRSRHWRPIASPAVPG
jgi:cation-transporting P-type ATPase F